MTTMKLNGWWTAAILYDLRVAMAMAIAVSIFVLFNLIFMVIQLHDCTY